MHISCKRMLNWQYLNIGIGVWLPSQLCLERMLCRHKMLVVRWCEEQLCHNASRCDLTSGIAASFGYKEKFQCRASFFKIPLSVYLYTNCVAPFTFPQLFHDSDKPKSSRGKCVMMKGDIITLANNSYHGKEIEWLYRLFRFGKPLT